MSNRRNQLFGYALIAAGVMSAAITTSGNARAATVFPMEDDFNADPTDWSPWEVNGAHSYVAIGWDGAAYSASRDARLLFQAGGTTSDFALIDKVFTLPATSPYPPAGVMPSFCQVFVELKPDWGAKGKVQMLDAVNWTYIGSTSFNYAPSSAWRSLRVDAVYSCTRSINVRVELDSTTLNQSVDVDNVQVDFYF